MKYFKFGSVLVFGLLCALFSTAQSSDENAVRSKVSDFNKAIIQPDRKSLEPLLHEKLSYGHSSGRIEDREAFLKDVIGGPVDFLTVETEGQTVVVAGNNAIVRFIFKSNATNNGQPLQIHIGVMMVWQKEKGDWKLLARQAYKLQ